MYLFLNQGLKVLIIVISWWYIYTRIFKGDNWKALKNSILSVENNNLIFFLSALLIMMMLNWGIEARKWQYLINKIEKIRYWKAVKAILAGLTVSSFTPNRVGEFVGRVFLLEKSEPLEGIFITIIGSISQLLTTLIMGCAGMWYFSRFSAEFTENPFIYNGFLILMTTITITSLLLYLNVFLISDLFRKLIKPNWVKIKGYMEIFRSFNVNELSYVLILSILRYMVFTCQFLLLNYFFNVRISFFDGFFLITLIYLIITAIPTFALTELGIRGSVAIFLFNWYFEYHGLNTHNLDYSVFSVVSFLWLINIAIPSLIGSGFVWQMKFFRK